MTLPTDAVKWASDQFNKDGRNEVIDVYEKYLDGQQPVAFATHKFRTAFAGLYDSFAYNRMQSVVESHADRLQITTIDANGDGVAAKAQQFWDANHMDVRENESTNDALSYGDGFISVEMHPTENRPVYWVNDPRLVRVHFDDQVPGRIDLAAKRWIEQDGYGYLNLYYEDRIKKYVTRNKVTLGSAMEPGAWTAKEDDEEIILPVSDTVPMFHLPNKARTNTYGKSELRQLIPLQDALNYVLMTGMVAAEFAAFTQKVIMGVDALDEDEKKLFNDFQLGVNKILTLYGDNARIGEFSPTNIQAYIDLAEWWDTTISRVSRVPVHYLRASNAPESGEAKRLNEQPFTSKIIDMQRQFGHVYGEVSRYGLRLTGMQNLDSGDVWVNWENAAPHSEEDRWRLVQLQQQAGVPFRASLKLAGFDEPEIEEMASEREMERLQAQRYFNAGMVDMRLESEEEAS